MKSLTLVAFKIIGAGFLAALIAGFFHPAPGWLLDLANVLGIIGVINLLVSLDMTLTRTRAERHELETQRARYVAAMEEQNGPMPLMMLQLPVDPPVLYVRCEIHGVRLRPRIHFHSDPPVYIDGVARGATALRACEGDCVPCPVCDEYH